MLARKSLSKKKAKVLIVIIILVWLIMGFVLWRNFFSKPSTLPPELLNNFSSSPNNIQIPAVQGDPKLLRESWYENLKQFGEVPIQVRGKGRVNPFESLAPPR